MRSLFNDAAINVKRKIAGIYGLLLVFNVGAWSWAILAFRHYPLLLGTASSPTVLVCAMPWTPITLRQSTT